MGSLQGFDFFRLPFDADGKLADAQAYEDFKQRASAGATDAILIAHGFRNDEADATGLYTRFLTTFRGQVDGPFHQSLGPRKYVVGGVYWPSKPFREVGDSEGSAQAADPQAAEKEGLKLQLQEMRDSDAAPDQKPKLDRALALLNTVEDNPAAQDEFVSLVLSLLDGSELDPTEGVDRIRATQGSELLDKLKSPIVLPTAAAGDEGGAAGVVPSFVPGQEGGVESIGSFFSSLYGRIGQFLNLTLWYVMKNRCGVVGGNGVAQTVRDLKATLPSLRVHLVGHSLGGRLMAACARSLAVPPVVRADSLTLLEAAFSHYGFSANNGQGQAGFFRSVVTSSVVRGPLIATFSAQDTVVGNVYAIASRLAGDNAQAIGDANDPYGGIGRNGAQKTDVATFEPLRGPGSAPYQFTIGKVVNLDGSGGLIKDHGDVTNASVTFAFASSVAQT